MNAKPPLRREMTVRQIAADYPACADLLRRYGEPDRPGIKFGHLEPLERFAARHRIDGGRLLNELAAAAGVGIAPDSSLTRNVHRPYIVMALATTLSIGAGWGGWLLWQIGSAGDFDAAAAGSIVAHGEAQLWGFIGLFIIGIALRYLPVATSRSAVPRWLARVELALLVFGTAGAFVWSVVPRRASWLGPASGASLAMAAAIYFAIALAYVGGKLRATWPRFIIAAASWLVIWAGYTLWLRANLAAAGPGAYSESARLKLLELAVFGFAMNSIYGFGLRLLPGLLGIGSPTSTPIEITCWLHNMGAAVLVAAEEAPWARAFGAGAIAAGAALYVIGMRGLRGRRPPPSAERAVAARPEIGERFLRRYVQLAFVWLLVSLTMLAASGARSIWSHQAPSHAFIGAARHALTVGFMTTLILGVAQRLLPVLGQTLLAWPGLVRPMFAFIAVGNLLRVGSELATDYWPMAYRAMPVSALFELTALTLFAANCLRTLWPPRDSLLRKGIVTEKSSLKILLAEYPAIEDALVEWGFAYISRVRAVPGELTIGSFAWGEGQEPGQTVERINTWLARRTQSIAQSEPPGRSL
jgi:hypothetical protein